ncbi:Hypothetical predicted protein [Scomber scombrus]|uniref:Uncharacterized protein n=1 Tax=Scomber scombrus TaxID=13677 RepID=A0AAV1Q3B0_SCOSC
MEKNILLQFLILSSSLNTVTVLHCQNPDSHFSQGADSSDIVITIYKGVEVTQLYTTIIKPRGTLWLASLEVTSAARAFALSAAHVLTGAPRQTRLILLLETSPDPVSVTTSPQRFMTFSTSLLVHRFDFALH